MATFFGVTSVPVDGAAATNATTTITLTPPASMIANDLVIVHLYQRGSATFSVGLTGGQAWNNFPRDVDTNISSQVFYCTYNGTWSVDPRFDFSAGTNTNAVMFVFRPNDSNNTLEMDYGGFASVPAAATITIAGYTPTYNNNLNLAIWTTADDNTWGTLTGTNWTKTGLSAQYRNTSGNDMSSTYAYQLQTTAQPTNNVSQTQLTLGNDLTVTRFIIFYELAAATPLDPHGSRGYFGL